MIGGSRQSVNRLLADLADEGLVRIERDVARRHRPASGWRARSSGDRPGRRRPDRRRDRPIHGRRDGRARARGRSRDRPPPRGRPPARPADDDAPPALDRRGDGRPVRRRGVLDRALRPGVGPARVPGRGRRARARASSGWRSSPTRGSPATCSRPACRSRSSDVAKRRPLRPVGRRADRLRAAVASSPCRSSTTRARSACSRSSTGGRRGGVRPARHRARRGLRPPGDRRDPGQPARARRGEPAGSALTAIAADGVAPATRRRRRRPRRRRGRRRRRRDARRARRTARCGPSPTRSPASGPPIPASSTSSGSCSGSSSGGRSEATRGRGAGPGGDRPDRRPATARCRPGARRSPPTTGPACARLAPLGRLDRDWAFGDGRRRRHHGRGRRLGRRGRPPGDRRRAPARASGSSSTARTRRSSTTMRSTSSATGRPSRRDRPRPGAGRRHRVGPRARARQPGQGPAFAAGLEWAIDQGAGIINLSLSSRSDAMFGVFHDLADRAYFAGVPARLRREQRRGRQLPVAVRGGRLGRRPRRPRPRASGSTTRSRRSSSGRTGSTSTSPGRAAAGSSRPATASPRRTSPGYAARIRATHPGASPFEVKTILAATADAATEPTTDRPAR